MAAGRFDDQVVIITGASSGIGWATAQLFAREGALTILAARREELLHSLRSEIKEQGGRAEVVVTDVSQRNHTENTATQITAVPYPRSLAEPM